MCVCVCVGSICAYMSIGSQYVWGEVHMKWVCVFVSTWSERVCVSIGIHIYMKWVHVYVCVCVPSWSEYVCVYVNRKSAECVCVCVCASTWSEYVCRFVYRSIGSAYVWVCAFSLVSLFNGISTCVGYLMPKQPF